MADYLNDKMARFTRRALVNVAGIAFVIMSLAISFYLTVFAHRIIHWFDGVPLP